MNWKLKCLASHVLHRLPCSDQIYDFVQQHLTRRWTRSVEGHLRHPTPYTDHLKTFRLHFGDISNARYFEFGVARDLFSNLLNYCHGIPEQIAVDLRPLARVELINHNIAAFQKIRCSEFVRVPERLLGSNFLIELKEWYGIDYRAPCDAARMEAADGTIDLIASTSTLEHIPPNAVRAILRECRRLCHERSILSMQIDYSDHYSHRDPTITPYNFLKFPERKWRHINMPHYYVNRLRHSDHATLFEEAGFRIISERSTIPPNAEQMLKSVKLAPEFQGYSHDDLMKVRGYFVLAPAS